MPLNRNSISKLSNKLRYFISHNKQILVQLSIVISFALLVRLLLIPLIPDEIQLDKATYNTAASEIVANRILTSDIIMPLYPLSLALFVESENAETFIGILLGLISVVLVWALTWSLFEDKKTALLAAVLMAIYPMGIFYSVKGLTESLFVPLVLGAFLALHKNRLTLASTLFVLSILTRPVMDAFAPFVIFWNAMVIRRAGISQACRDLLVYGVLYAIIMSPWWYHNQKKYDQFVRLNNGFGLVLYAGNNPLNKSGGGINKRDYDVEKFFDDQVPVSSIKFDHALRDAAVEYILNDPGNFFKMAGVKFVRFWSLMPYTPMVKGNNLASIATLSLLPIILLAFLTFITKRDLFWHLTPMLGFILYLTLVHMITIGSVRYRYPLEPLLIVSAAPSLLLVWNLIFGKRI
jgi:hypothetical protein